MRPISSPANRGACAVFNRLVHSPVVKFRISAPGGTDSPIVGLPLLKTHRSSHKPASGRGMESKPGIRGKPPRSRRICLSYHFESKCYYSSCFLGISSLSLLDCSGLVDRSGISQKGCVIKDKREKKTLFFDIWGPR